MTQIEIGAAAKADWLSTLTAEALVFGLLGKALYASPDRAWIQALADEGVFDEAPLGSEEPKVSAGLALLQLWARESQGGMTDEAFEALCNDYTRLFVGPGMVLAPPWESVHCNEERLVFQEQTLEVRAWYRRFGLEAERLHQEPDDHIGLELVFLAHLARLGLEALEAGDGPALAGLLASQRAFLLEHPLRWTSVWCSQVEAQARTGFFQGMALLTVGMLQEAAKILEDGV
jgi:putative dimethyl sulfoxide reductase chaperone